MQLIVQLTKHFPPNQVYGSVYSMYAQTSLQYMYLLDNTQTTN